MTKPAIANLPSIEGRKALLTGFSVELYVCICARRTE
jgi:hypothetical protein